MASTRKTAFENLCALLANISGINGSGHGPQWPYLQSYVQGQLPLAWVKHDSADIDNLKMKSRYDEKIIIRIYYIDFNTDALPSTFEDWIEKVVEAIAADYTLSSSVDFISPVSYEYGGQDFPINWVEIIMNMVYQTDLTNV
jgi:hypothetical protein